MSQIIGHFEFDRIIVQLLRPRGNATFNLKWPTVCEQEIKGELK